MMLENNPLITVEALAKLHDEVYHWALSQCYFSVDDAEEVFQSAYLQIINGKAQYKGESSLKTWWYAVVRNIAQQHFRRFKIHTQYIYNQINALLHSDEHLDETTAETTLQADQSNTCVFAALKSLSRRQRDMIELVFYREMTIEEAASILDVSIGTARVHYQRAKENLRNRLKELRENDRLFQ